jgi:hypothetical protein
VAGAVVGREAEQAAVQDLLDGVGAGPATLALWGEAGIGKTTISTSGVVAAARVAIRCFAADRRSQSSD